VSGGARVRSGGDGAGATRQQVRWRGRGPLAGEDGGGGCAAPGAGGGGRAHGGGTRVWGARVSGGVDDPDVCGLWFQEYLPLCMVITSYILFFSLI
jgi:hypothetical protein